jgi:hypothetical protein
MIPSALEDRDLQGDRPMKGYIREPFGWWACPLALTLRTALELHDSQLKLNRDKKWRLQN